MFIIYFLFETNKSIFKSGLPIFGKNPFQNWHSAALGPYPTCNSAAFQTWYIGFDSLYSGQSMSSDTGVLKKKHSILAKIIHRYRSFHSYTMWSWFKITLNISDVRPYICFVFS